MSYLIKFYGSDNVYLITTPNTIILSVLGGYALNLNTDKFDLNYKFSGYKEHPLLEGLILNVGDMLYKNNKSTLLVLDTDMSMGHIKCWDTQNKVILLISSFELAKLSRKRGVKKTTISLLSEDRVKSMLKVWNGFYDIAINGAYLCGKQ